MQKKSDKRYLAAESLEKLRTTIVDLFSEGLYHQVGIREICKKAGVSPHTVYKYFGSKEELLYASISEDMKSLANRVIAAAAVQTKLSDKLRAFSESFFTFYYENPSIAKIVYLNIPTSYWVDDSKFVQRQYHEYILGLIKQGQADGLVAPHDPEILLEMVMGAAYRLIVKWLVDSENVDFHGLVNTFNDVVLQLIQDDE